MNYVALVIFLIVYGMIAVRGVRGINIPPWASMSLGAVLMVLGSVIPLQEAFSAVDLNVIIFLISLFSISSALEVSGFLEYLAGEILRRSRNMASIMLYTLVASGLLSTLVTNDGIASTWTPVILKSSKIGKIEDRPLLYSLAFGITIGSVLLPTGNPQNLLIALDTGIPDPFLTFLIYLTLPTLVNLGIAYALLRIYFRDNMEIQWDGEVKVKDRKLASLALSLLVFLVSVYFLSGIVSLGPLNDVTGSMLAMSLLYTLSSRRREVLKNLDWSTILFFISLFMFTKGVLSSGIVSLLTSFLPLSFAVGSILVAGVLYSQVLSNVPMVAIYIPLLESMGHVPTVTWIALAAGSTIAGNLTILGAASNIIISESSESRGGMSLNFLEFLKYGAPLTFVNVLVYYLFLVVLRP